MQAKFVEGSLFRHVAVMSLTASVGLMAIFIVDLINMLYISWLGDPVLTAAIGFAGAVLFFTTAFGIGLSIGVSAMVAQALGARDIEAAKRRATAGLWVSGAIGIAFTALTFVFLPQLLQSLGAEGRTYDEALHFLRLVTPGQVLLMLGMVGSNILRAHGAARRSMMVTVWAGVVLAVLDAVFILWLDLALTGAAIAGWGSRLMMVAWALWPIHRHYGGFVRLNFAGICAAARPMVKISGPAILTQLATPVGQAMVTRMVAGFGEAAVSGMTLVGRLTPVAFAMLFAMAGALGPIIGQNLGAGRFDRVRRAFWDAILFTAIVISAMSFILWLGRDFLAAQFHAEGLAREILYLFCGPLSLLFFFNGVIFAANAACNNLGAAMQATWVNWGRHTLGTWPFAYLLMHYAGAQGVLIGQAVGGIAFGLLALWLALRAITRRENLALVQLQGDANGR